MRNHKKNICVNLRNLRFNPLLLGRFRHLSNGILISLS